MRFKDFFILNLRKTVIIIAVWIAIIFFHNLIIRFFVIKETFLFSLAVVIIPIYLIVGFIYTVFLYKNNSKKSRRKR